MSSRSVLQTVGYNPHVGDQHSPLPPPPRDAPFPSPLRRQNVLHPPVLTTGIASNQASSPYSTPLTGLSPHHLSPGFAPSPAVPSSSTYLGTSAMASRLSGHFSVPYDPRDWAPGTDTRAAQIQRIRENAAEDGLASPPPPYTPGRSQPQGLRSTTSPSTGLERSQTLSTSQSPGLGLSFPPRRGIPASGASPANRHSVHIGSYVPPPPSAAPPMPRSRVVSDMHSGYDTGQSVPEVNNHPPAARRAASANAGISRPSEAGPSRSSSRQRTWLPGMPLPGPPPGPPPPTSRSQSTSGAYDRPGQPQPKPRFRQTIHVSDLGPVPPTPSTWTEDQPLPNNPHMPLHIDTVNVPGSSHLGRNNVVTRNDATQFNTSTNSAQANHAASAPVSSPPATLSRSSAVRDSSAKGLRERRAQNRNSLILNGDANVLSALSVQTNPWADALSGEGSSKRADGTPLSGGPRSAHRLGNASSPLAVITHNSAQLSASPIQMTGTPPISPMPNIQASMQSLLATRSAGLPPKSLPTPPLTLQAPLSANSVIPIQREPPVILMKDDIDNFQREAIQRHTLFLDKEKQAKSDVERLQVFAEYILQEASVRHKKYETAFSSGDFDVEHLRANLFKPLATSRSASISQVSGDEHEATTKNTTPQARPETMWWKDYHPELSPIASMDYDEMSSRGRAPSRWWESQTGSQSGGAGPRKVHRSKRESKYMGLSKEFLMAHSPSDELPNMFNQTPMVPDDSSYPPEKANPDTFGYYNEDTPRRIPIQQAKKPEAPALLDISRFITLPPPYPRHYPAVNNNHPELAQYRTTVRTLGDLEEIKARKARHGTSQEALRSDHQRRLSDSRRSFRNNIQAQVADGNISFAEAAEAEEAFKISEFDAGKQSLKAEFDTLQDMVINPLHDMLHERITQLDTSIQRLQDDLHTDARYQDPDQTQEEGDEKPELLEKLTQLKWLFDVREQIHRECFDLLSERNDKYKAIVLFPYQFTKNAEKVRETESFFGQDTQNRYATYCDESFRRHESFLQIVEQHVSRGVELQSSAFWDIAPGLLDLLQKIPEDLRSFDGIQIPEKEYKENPSYHKHPQQYLYSLLSHAEKSTYQFIEGQVNLHCLLHEVKNSTLVSRYRVLQLKEGNLSPRQRDFSDSKAQEESGLTVELKQKAGMIEEQWLEALGSQLQAKRECVKALLQENDAWEEIAAEDA